MINAWMLVAVLIAAPAGAATQSKAAIEAELKRMTNELLAAIAPGDVAVWKNGTYKLTDEIRTDAGLQSERTGRKPVTQKAEVLDVFFEPGQPRTRRIFQRNERGEITGFVDRREGHDITWTKIE